MKFLKRAGERALYYIRQGYALASLPFVFLGYASSIYYLAIENIPFLQRIFPRFSTFLLVAGITIPIFCGFIGYIYMKRSWLFRIATEIQTEANPYTTEKIPKISIPIWKLFKAQAMELGLIDLVEQIEVIIKRSM